MATTPITGIRTAEGVNKIDYSALVNVPQFATSQDLTAIENRLKQVIEAAINDLPPAYSYGTDDLTAGTSELATGKVHFVYE